MAATTMPVPTALPVPASHYSAHPTFAQNAPTVNILLTTFAGLGLPRTLSLPVARNATVADVLASIYARLPAVDHPLFITTTSNKQLRAADTSSISTLLSDTQDTFLPLRLSARLCGGKGGFGSQLRAAGGRMSSRKNRNQQDANPTGSNRNLDGRRLRTVDEAKRLADYLAIKPEMEQKEKDERKKRWEAVVETAEKREQEIKSGKAGASQGRLDADYVESKEDAEERTRAAVMKSMREGILSTDRTGSESSMDVDAGNESDNDDDEEGSSGSSDDAKTGTKETAKEGSGRTFFGWDEDEEDFSEDEEAGGAPLNEALKTYEGKGKGKAL